MLLSANYFSGFSKETLEAFKQHKDFKKCVSVFDGVECVIAFVDEDDSFPTLVLTPINDKFDILLMPVSLKDLSKKNWRAIYYSGKFLHENYKNDMVYPDFLD